MKPIVHVALRLCAWLAIAFALAGEAGAETVPTSWYGTVEAVRGGWNDAAPPPDGWVAVTLPDRWTDRWADHDGVVWYRLRWSESAANAERAIMLPYINLAGAISLGQTLLYSDPSLVEPLSRSINHPVFVRLPSALLRQGENELLIRVSGLAYHGPGLPQIAIGAPQDIRAVYDREHDIRIDAQMYGQAAVLTLGGFFLVTWLLRRRETVYGWAAATALLWWLFTTNELARSPWPFGNTDTYVKALSSVFVVYCACSVLFQLRFAERRFPRAEGALWLAALVACAVMALTPHADIRGVRDVLLLVPGLLAMGAWVLLCVFAWISRRAEQRFLAAWMSLSMLGYVHDILMFLRVIDGQFYYTAFTTQLNCIGMALAMLWRFAANLKRVEGFNVELKQSVADARGELATTLKRQHELELVQARLGERLSLAHDLHDGLGGMLIGNIATLEEAPETIPTRRMLAVLRELRDDLRLIIDTASAQTYGEDTLGQLVAPLRHRMTHLFETRRIAIRWRVEGTDELRLTSTQSMDILRVLQEALTNVLKHSGATAAEVELIHLDERLRLEVRDDGIGLPAENATLGTGMRSMRLRAQRLGAQLTTTAREGITSIRLEMPLRIAR